VLCNYDGANLDLQLMVERAAAPSIPNKDMKLPPYLSFQVSEHEQLLKRFRNRTAFTVSDGKRLCIYQNEVITLARSVGPASSVMAEPFW
jgi:hypothetical protein